MKSYQNVITAAVDFTSENYEWLFSGIGLTIVAWVASLLFKRRTKNSAMPEKNIRNKFSAGGDVTNLHVEGNLNVADVVVKTDPKIALQKRSARLIGVYAGQQIPKGHVQVNNKPVLGSKTFENAKLPVARGSVDLSEGIRYYNFTLENYGDTKIHDTSIQIFFGFEGVVARTIHNISLTHGDRMELIQGSQGVYNRLHLLSKELLAMETVGFGFYTTSQNVPEIQLFDSNGANDNILLFEQSYKVVDQA
ncbi:MAG: hypothetical protein AAF607_13215 [Pseudomonadota bacterium]